MRVAAVVVAGEGAQATGADLSRRELVDEVVTVGAHGVEGAISDLLGSRCFDRALVLHAGERFEPRIRRDLLEALLAGPATAWTCGLHGEWPAPGFTAGTSLSQVRAYASPPSDEHVPAHAALRILRPMAEEAAGWAVDGLGQHRRVQAFEPASGIGLAMLCHEDGQAGDVAWWMRAIGSLLDSVALVWTADCLPPTWLVAMEGADTRVTVLHRTLADDLGEARNAGIEVLQWQERGLGWALVLDPDERPEDFDKLAVQLRAMATFAGVHGWVFRFKNLRPDGGDNASENIRMFRLDAPIRFHGRVHEHVTPSLEAMRERGDTVRTLMAPFTLRNTGLAIKPVAMEAKLRRYERLLRLELADHPHNSQAWVCLARQYRDDGHEAEALACADRAVACAGPQNHLAHLERGWWHLRAAERDLEESGRRMDPNSELRADVGRLLAILRANGLHPPVLGVASSSREPLPLPEPGAP